jgi:branched-chain amino acid aminotransferase
VINIQNIYKGYIWYNGSFMPWQQCQMHVFTNSLHYASSAFEGIRSYNGKIFKLEQHIDRFLYSSQILGLASKYTHQELCDYTLELIKKNNLQNSYIRPLIWRGDKELTIKYYDNDINIMIAAYNYEQEFDIKKTLNLLVTPWRKGPANSMPHQAKTAGNYVINVTALTEIRNLEYDDVLFLDTQDYIAELSSSNIFFVKNNILITPIANCCLNGITRKTIIEIARENNIKVEERHIALEELESFDEAFATGTAAEISVINSVTLDKDGNNKVTFLQNTMTKKIAELYSKLVRN